MNGIINIYKPEGITSYGVIRDLKKKFHEKKIGHIGTLDPLAEGVSPFFFGKMTKLIPYFNQLDKSYRATICLGAKSTTLDREGELTEVPLPENSPEKIKKVVLSFLGEHEQIPPMYSAVKVKGVRLYKHARKGETIERKPRKFQIFKISDIEIRFPEISFTVCCSKGTYIRVLAEDIGKSLGTEAYLKKLIRIGCGKYFSLDNAFKLDQIINIDKSSPTRFLIPPQNILPRFHKLFLKTGKEIEKITQGAKIKTMLQAVEFSSAGKSAPETIALDEQNSLVAIGNLEFNPDQSLWFCPIKVLI